MQFPFSGRKHRQKKKKEKNPENVTKKGKFVQLSRYIILTVIAIYETNVFQKVEKLSRIHIYKVVITLTIRTEKKISNKYIFSLKAILEKRNKSQQQRKKTIEKTTKTANN